MSDRQYPSEETISILSTGDPEKDAEELARAIRNEKRMIEGICPNGCAVMILDDPHNRHCPKCKFHGWSNVPFPVIESDGEERQKRRDE